MAFSFLKRKKKKKEEKNSPYFDLIVKEVVQETKDAVSIVFEEPKSESFSYRPGQFITLIQNVNGKKIRRAYSLSSTSALGELPTVTVKKVEGGQMSNHVNDHIKSGDVINVMEPMGTFTIDINEGNKRHLYLFGGGSGITPLMSIAKTVLKVETGSKVSLLYANRDEESIIFKDKLMELQSEYADRLNVIHYLEKFPSDWSGEQGYMTTEKLTANIQTLSDEAFSEVEYMTCGPEPMMNVVMETLDQLNVPNEKKHKESFVAGTTSPSDIIDNDVSREVTIVFEGEEHKYEVAPDKTILEAGLDQGIDLPYSCQSGLCTACRGNCKQGDIQMDDVNVLSDEEKSEGYVLLCVSKPKSDDIVVEIG